MAAKTKADYQAAINDVRRVLAAHGVVMVASQSYPRGTAIELFDAETLREDPSPCYVFHNEPPGTFTDPMEMHKFNEVRHDVIRSPIAHGGALENFRVKAIGDVEGIIPIRITVHQHLTAIGDMNVGNTLDVLSLDDVENVPFVKEWKDEKNFSHFECTCGDGPFGTLVAYSKGAAGRPIPLTVAAFIEGPSPEKLIKKWPPKQGEQDEGSV
jgi:hypothetical protein